MLEYHEMNGNKNEISHSENCVVWLLDIHANPNTDQ